MDGGPTVQRWVEDPSLHTGLRIPLRTSCLNVYTTLTLTLTLTLVGGFCVLRRLRTIRRSVPVFQSLVVSLVLNRLDFGNARFAALLAHQYRRLHAVCTQRCGTTSLIYRRRRFDHVTPLLRYLHWLKVPERVAYKLAMTVYRCLHGMTPPYLCDGLQRRSATCCRTESAPAAFFNVQCPCPIKADILWPQAKAKPRPDITATSYTIGRSQVSRGNPVSQGQTGEV